MRLKSHNVYSFASQSNFNCHILIFTELCLIMGRIRTALSLSEKFEFISSKVKRNQHCNFGITVEFR